MNNREGYTPPKYHGSSLDLPNKATHTERSSAARPNRSNRPQYGQHPAVEPDTRLGWTFRAQKEYVRRRFDNLRPIGNPVINHKVEQVLRAIIYGYTVSDIAGAGGQYLSEGDSILKVSAVGDSTFTLYTPEQVLQIGKLTRKGSALNAEANSALAVLGFNGNAVLHWLSRMRIVDDLTGFADVCIVNDGEFIYTTYGALANLARDVVFNRELILKTYHGATGYVRPAIQPRG